MSCQTAQSAATLRRSRALLLVTWQLNGPVRLLSCVAVRIADLQQWGPRPFGWWSWGPQSASRSNFLKTFGINSEAAAGLRQSSTPCLATCDTGSSRPWSATCRGGSVPI
jgi:hypothetical protein